MGAFKSAVITKKGQALMAKVVSGATKLEFTKIAVGDSDLKGDLASLTGIGTIRQSEKVASIVRQNESNVKVSARFSNEKLQQGYSVKNIGLYANDPQDGEICYSISVADESSASADWMPPFNGIGVSSLLVDLITAVSNASNVTVTVDPSAGATVAQIIDLQEQIDDVKSFVGYEDEDVYGVEVDFVNKKFTRLAGAENLTAGADFDKLDPWKRRRCILADDGVVLAYHGEDGYVETGATAKEIKKTVDGVEKTYPVGTAVQVMVEQPIFYVKAVPVKSAVAGSGRGKQYSKGRFYISPTPKAGFQPIKGFRDANGNLQDKIYLAAYEGCIWDADKNETGAYILDDAAITIADEDKLSSIANAKPASGAGTTNLTRANARKMANKRGAGWQLHNVFAMAVSEWLVLIEYATFDVQTAVGKGVCSFVDDATTNMAVKTGGTSGLGNKSGTDPNKTEEDAGKCSVSYRGEENLWGNIWTWLDGILEYNTKDQSTVYVKEYGEMKDDTTGDGYTPLDFEAFSGVGYVSAFGIDGRFAELLIPTAVGGTTNLPVGNYFWNQNTGFRVAGLGGRWDDGAYCGWYFIFNGASSYRYRDVGGRLLYVPQTKLTA